MRLEYERKVPFGPDVSLGLLPIATIEALKDREWRKLVAPPVSYVEQHYDDFWEAHRNWKADPL